MAHRGEAGRRGSDVRSDCWVGFTPSESGGIELRLDSKVASMYGRSTEEMLLEAVERLGVKDGTLEVEDAGALPFVITARLEAAIKRASPETTGSVSPPMAPCATYPTRRDRFRRSRLYLPGNEPKFMISAGLHKPDGVILDLEDSVAPSEKDAARILVRNALAVIDFCGAERMVRINQGDPGLEDIATVIPQNVHLILIPKCESGEDVARVDAKIRDVRARADADPVLLMPIVESGLGAINAYEIATASENVVALAIGLEDYTADIGAERTAEGWESFWARSQVLNAARAARVQPIDSVFSDVADTEALRANVRRSKAMGFDGMGCIHPRQIAVIHDALAPGDAALKKAKRIVLAFEDAERRGLGVVSLGSKMIDPPVVKRALRTVDLAVQSGVLKESWRGEGAE